MSVPVGRPICLALMDEVKEIVAALDEFENGASEKEERSCKSMQIERACFVI